jgi:hypothetical protein
MTFKEAEATGGFCGCGTLQEIYNNIAIHCTMLFKYEDIEKELHELRNDILLTQKCCGNCFYADEGVCDNHDGDWAGEISTLYCCNKHKRKDAI